MIDDAGVDRHLVAGHGHDEVVETTRRRARRASRRPGCTSNRGRGTRTTATSGTTGPCSRGARTSGTGRRCPLPSRRGRAGTAGPSWPSGSRPSGTARGRCGPRARSTAALFVLLYAITSVRLMPGVDLAAEAAGGLGVEEADRRGAERAEADRHRDEDAPVEELPAADAELLLVDRQPAPRRRWCPASPVPRRPTRSPCGCRRRARVPPRRRRPRPTSATSVPLWSRCRVSRAERAGHSTLRRRRRGADRRRRSSRRPGRAGPGWR